MLLGVPSRPADSQGRPRHRRRARRRLRSARWSAKCVAAVDGITGRIGGHSLRVGSARELAAELQQAAHPSSAARRFIRRCRTPAAQPRQSVHLAPVRSAVPQSADGRRNTPRAFGPPVRPGHRRRQRAGRSLDRAPSPSHPLTPVSGASHLVTGPCAPRVRVCDARRTGCEPAGERPTRQGPPACPPRHPRSREPPAGRGGLSLVPSCPHVRAYAMRGRLAEAGQVASAHASRGEATVRDPRPDPPAPPLVQAARRWGGTKCVGLRAAAEKSEFVGRGSERAERGGWEWGGLAG